MEMMPLEDEVTVLAAQLHATTARFIDAATTFDQTVAWATGGMRSCAHWLTVTTGIELWNAREMLRVGHALRELPRIHAGFESGQLSFDKVRAVTRVAVPADEAIWLDVALQSSGAQLSRICREFRRSVATDDPQRAELQRARRRVASWWLDDDGMLALYAILPPEEGRLVLNAIDSAVTRRLAPDDEPDHPHGARRADALVRICERWLDDTAATAPTGAATPSLVVHVDAAVLNGVDQGGRCHLEGGPAISPSAVRRLGCDAEVVVVRERDGVPVDVGRSRRVVSGRMRRLLQLRDAGCRYPGCDVPAADTDGHHVVHWIDGGRTELPNLVSLCRFHDHRHHEGLFRIVRGETREHGFRDFRFETADGRAIGAVGFTGRARDTGRSGQRSRDRSGAIGPLTPAARGGGQSFDLDHTVLVLASNIAIAAARGANPMASGP